MQKTKEVKLNVKPENFKIKYGVIDRNNPSCIYAIIATWVSPKKQETDYRDTCFKFSLKTKKIINDKLSSFTEDEIITDVDIRSAGIEFAKRKFVDIEVCFNQKDILPVDSLELKDKMNTIFSDITTLLQEQTDFEFYNKKC